MQVNPQEAKKNPGTELPSWRGEKKKEKTSVAETPPLDNQGCALGQDGLDSFLVSLNQ
jgi:hypothetical protein